MTVYLVGAGPGDPGLLTVRGRELLGRCDALVYDRLADPRIVALAPASAKRVYAGKQPDRHAPQGVASSELEPPPVGLPQAIGERLDQFEGRTHLAQRPRQFQPAP